MTDFWITTYGADVTKADNQSSIDAAIAAAVAAGGPPHHRVRVPVGMFKHSNRIYARVSISGTNSDPARGAVSGLFATGEVRSVNIDGTKTGAKQIIIEDLYLTGTGVSRSPGTPSKNAILIEKGASNFIIRNNYIEGPNQNPDGDDTTPNIGGIFMHSVSNGLVERNTCRYTSADSIHVTGGSNSHDIIIEYNRIEFPGDDSTAFVTYSMTSRVTRCISRYNTSFRSRNGRCFTSIGTQDCQILYNWGENTSATVPKNNGGKAGVMVGAESSYNSPGSVRLKVYRNTFVQTGGTISGHAAIHQYVSSYSYSSNPAASHLDNTYEDNQIIQPRRSAMVIDGLDGGTNTKFINNKVYALGSGQVAMEIRPSTIPKRGFVESGTTVQPLSAWSTATPHAIKNIGGAYTTARHPADPLYNGEQPPVTPEQPPELPAGAVSKTITSISGALLRQSTPDTNYSAAALWTVDGENPASSGQRDITVLRFDNLVGSGAGQIPAGATILSATLRLQSTDGGHNATFHKLLQPWTPATVTWNNFTAGTSANDVGASSVVEASSGVTVAGSTPFDVKSSVQDWVDGSPNYGWTIIPASGSVDGWTFYGSAGTTPPKLDVTYQPTTAPPPTVEEESIIASGTAVAGLNRITFRASSNDVIFRLSKVGSGTVTVTDIEMFPVNEDESGGTDPYAVDVSTFIGRGGTASGGTPGTFSVDTVARTVTITANSASATFIRGYHPVTVGQSYRVSWDAGPINVQAGFGTSEGGPQYQGTTHGAVGANSFSFVATTSTLWLNFQRVQVGTVTVSNIRVVPQ